MKTKNKTTVIFRTFIKGGDVIALFPFIPADYTGWNCESYQHVGQHGGADPHLVDDATRPATMAEAAQLHDELTRLGYDLAVMKRFPSNAFDVRKAVLKAMDSNLKG